MRLFFAILLPDDVRAQLNALQSELRERLGGDGIRWEDCSKLHITLRFLGEVPREKLESVMRAGREAARKCPPFHLSMRGIGAFPARGQPRVLWAGASGGLPEFVRLAEYLQRSLSECGLTKTRHWATPHVTLARVKSPEGAKSIHRTFSAKDFKEADKEGVIFVCTFVLVDSELRPSGSVYTVLENFDLAKV